MNDLYTIQDLYDKNLIIFSCISGSHAYGTSMPTSDKDLRGVFIQPLNDILKYGFIDQISDDKNDIIFYELKRFLLLSQQNNPNILELLFMPDGCILSKTKEWDLIQSNSLNFISKLCKTTFAGYALSQINKSGGYNKKINWEESKMKRKTVLDFCYVLDKGGSKPFKTWLREYFFWHSDESYERLGYNHFQKMFGLAVINHAKDIYALYNLVDPEFGIVSDEETANDIKLTSIPKGVDVIKYLAFNKDAYSSHCKSYKEYQTWLKERNVDRFKMNKEHGKNYDSKNLMHLFRLLNVSKEIALIGKMTVKRPIEEIETLMKIRRGEYEYEDLINESKSMICEIDDLYEKSSLPNKIDENFILDLQYQIRQLNYKL